MLTLRLLLQPLSRFLDFGALRQACACSSAHEKFPSTHTHTMGITYLCGGLLSFISYFLDSVTAHPCDKMLLMHCITINGFCLLALKYASPSNLLQKSKNCTVGFSSAHLRLSMLTLSFILLCSSDLKMSSFLSTSRFTSIFYAM